MVRLTRLSACWGVAAMALPLLAGAATSQEMVRNDTVPPVPIAPVIVTVLRTPFTLTAAPYSVAVNGERQIQRGKPGLGLDEALRGIPGVQVDNRHNYSLGERISIRGFGARAQFGVRGIKVLVDGLPATLPDGQTSLTHIDMKTLGRAEVIRGPASALYGNTAGGVIQFETREPPLAPLGQDVEIVAGGAGMLRLASSTGGRSGPASYMLNLGRLTYAGYREFASAENNYFNGRVGFGNDRSNLRFNITGATSEAQNPGSLTADLLQADRLQALPINLRQQAGKTTDEGQVGLIGRHRVASGELEVAAHGSTRHVVNPIVPFIIDLRRKAGGGRAVFRANTLPSLAQLQPSLGVEVDRQVDDRTNFGNERGERGALRLDQLEHVDNIGFFAQVASTPSTQINLLGGLRYDLVRFQVEDRFVSATNPDDSGERTMSAFSPSVGVSFLPSDAVTLYGNFATSFQTPTTTELANRPDGAGGFNPELEPQTALSFEAGLKGRVTATAAYQLAAYRTGIENALIPFEVPNVAGRQFFRNAGSAVHQGLEAGITVVPLRGLTTQLAYSYTDAHFTNYTVGGVSFEGKEIPGVAPHRLDLIAGYTAPAGVYVEGETRWVSEMAVNDENTSTSPGYSVTDLRGGLENLRFGRFGLAPFVGVTNLFDREYNTSVTVNAAFNRFFEPGPGRTFYVGARAGVATR